jgi:hypothetical protein
MKTWIMAFIQSPKKLIFQANTDVTNESPRNSLEEPMSKTIEIAGLRHTCTHILENSNFIISTRTAFVV